MPTTDLICMIAKKVLYSDRWHLRKTGTWFYDFGRCRKEF